jgi:threonine/homoserine/homoserine lactone efflux protein
MDLDLYLAFVLATAILIVIPGPSVSLIVATSIAHGPRSALTTVAGNSSAIVIQLTVTAMGMTSILLMLSEWFEVLRWAGVIYLAYLGVRHWRAAPSDTLDSATQTVAGKRHYWRGFVVCAVNPKVLFFYAAFFPQFIDPQRPPELQLAVLCVTFLVVQMLLDGSYAILAGRVRGLLGDPKLARLRGRLTGSLMIGAGVGLALARRS